MKMGARNQLEGEVCVIKRGDVMCLVKVRLVGGTEIDSVMTLEYLDELNLAVGDWVRVAVKPVDVLIHK
jgi:molybdate transport system regulatory protein